MVLLLALCAPLDDYVYKTVEVYSFIILNDKEKDAYKLVIVTSCKQQFAFYSEHLPNLDFIRRDKKYRIKSKDAWLLHLQEIP